MKLCRVGIRMPRRFTAFPLARKKFPWEFVLLFRDECLQPKTTLHVNPRAGLRSFGQSRLRWLRNPCGGIQNGSTLCMDA